MKQISEKDYVGYWIRRFLSDYLTCVRNLSINTVMAYRDAIRMLVVYLSRKKHKQPDELTVTDITPQEVLALLEHIEQTRKCSIKTRNLRRSAFVSLSKFIASNRPEYIEWCRGIKNIPVKKSPRTMITYLDKKEMDALLNLPDKQTEQGWRDYVLLLFLYNTGARAEEAATLQVKDLFIPKGKGIPVVTITGKGSKTRRCPLWNDTCKLLHDIVDNKKPDDNVFMSRLHKPISRFGIYEMVTKYARKLEETMPSIKGKRISPHTIRHTTATHLLLSGVDINTIRAWLGHVSVETTNIYAEVNLEMKAKALESLDFKEKRPHRHWRNDKKLMDFLDNLV